METKNDHIEHFQIKGAKWGIRRFQNRDGSLTPAGRERYGYGKGSKKKPKSSSKSKEIIVKPVVDDAYIYQLSEQIKSKPKSSVKENRAKGREIVNKIVNEKGRAEAKKLSSKDNEKKDKKTKIPLTNENAKLIKSAGDVVKESSSSIGKELDTQRSLSDKRRAAQEALTLTSKELAERTQRLNLEEAYISARSKELARGRRAYENILKSGSDFLNLAATTVNFAAGVSAMQNSKKK